METKSRATKGARLRLKTNVRRIERTSEFSMKKTSMVFFILVSFTLVTATPQEERFCVPVAGEKVNLRTGPGIQYPVSHQVSYEEGVFILQKSVSKTKIGTFSDYWYQVEKMDSTTGWIFGQYLGTNEKFKRPGSPRKHSFKFCVGDYCPTFTVFPDGSAIRSYQMCLGGDCTEEMNRKECLQSGGAFKTNPTEYGSVDICTHSVPVKIYREIHQFPEFFIIRFYGRKPCSMLKSQYCGCVNNA